MPRGEPSLRVEGFAAKSRGRILSGRLAGDVAAIRELLDRTVGKATLPVEAGAGVECAGITFLIHRAE